jgi:hypothetical protein
LKDVGFGDKSQYHAAIILFKIGVKDKFHEIQEVLDNLPNVRDRSECQEKTAKILWAIVHHRDVEEKGIIYDGTPSQITDCLIDNIRELSAHFVRFIYLASYSQDPLVKQVYRELIVNKMGEYYRMADRLSK